MAAVYGVEERCVLPVRGAMHAIELVLRLIKRDDRRGIASTPSAPLSRLCELYGVEQCAPPDAAAAVARPNDETEVRSFTSRCPDCILLIDERDIEIRRRPSLSAFATSQPRIAVYREISPIYGVKAPLCGAIVADRALIARLASVLEPDFLPALLAEEALAALAPQRLALLDGRIGDMAREWARLRDGLATSPMAMSIVDDAATAFSVVPTDAAEILLRARRLEAPVFDEGNGRLRVAVADPQANERTLAVFGASHERRAPRIAEATRETKETRIAVRVDLDRAGTVRIATGVGYFDHMLEQIAAHSGISVQLACDGDVHVDLHHSIEDCALALGSALSKALGERRGIARYGFTLPMDEAAAHVSIDLGGRPYAVFEGAFAAPTIGAYPTEMTAHVFRSLAQSLGAAIHVSVKGENDHHKTEASFKAFARALRAAIAIEGDEVPSTKGVV
jgi:imidazoleglycerol phosphate dehydratase HisB